MKTTMEPMMKTGTAKWIETLRTLGPEFEERSRRSDAAKACVGVVKKAMELVGGRSFYRKFGLERLFRDVQGAKYHPLQEKDQLQFLGEFLLR